SAERIGSHTDELTAAERRQVLAVTGELRSRLGYDRLPASSGKQAPRLLLRIQDTGLRAAVEYRSFRHDHNYWQRQRRDAVVRLIGVRAAGRAVGRAAGRSVGGKILGRR